jgi:predicted Zn-dependent protease
MGQSKIPASKHPLLINMTEQATSPIDIGLERYNAGEGPDTLIPFFKEICARTPKAGVAWSCLAWLYMLDNQPAQAYKAAQKAAKLDAGDAQTRINLAIAMLEAGQPGVRQHVQAAQEMLALDSQLRQQVQETLEEGLSRKPDWDSLKRVQNWLKAT